MAMGALLIMIAAVAALVSQTQHSLRLSQAEPNVLQIEELVVAEFTKAAAKVDAAAKQGLIWPDAFLDELSQPDQLCTPTQRWIASASYPLYCVQALARQPVATTYHQVQMRVRYQAYPGATITTQYGWIVTNSGNFWRVYYQHDWCAKRPGSGAAVPSCVKDG